ncbi:MAG: hypothetical protein ABIY52_06640 [Gemmatimonadaceae bacterium]
MSVRRTAASLNALILPLLLAPTARAQQVAAFTCAGETVSRIEISASPPPFSGAAKKWQAAAHTIGLHHATTRDPVIATFLSLAPGRPCTEFRRAESERVLRAQPFLADAAVRVVRDTAGMVAVMVTTTDEVPVLVSGRLRGIVPEAFSLGNENIGGEALRIQGRIERGRAYRLSYGLRVEQHALFGHPYRLMLNADQFRVGHQLSAEIEHPFYTDLQRFSWHGGISTRDDYFHIERPARDLLSLAMTDQAYDVSALLRVFGTRTVTLLGAAMTGRRVDPASTGIVVSDSGLRPDTGVTLNSRYASFRSGRIGAIAGIRRVSFKTVRGFDALVATQDVASGIMLGVFGAKGLEQFGESDAFVSSALYAGVARGNALLATLTQVEGRRDQANGEWDSVIGSARNTFYWGAAPGFVFVLADEFSGGRRSRLPLQLTFDDPEGGLMGYSRSALAGERRNVARGELRFSAANVTRRADLGFATFGEVGTLWAGDAPYGANATRASVGFSILAAYPTHSKRMYRADFAFPLTRSGSGAGRFEVRFSSEDRTQRFWEEPRDLSRARTGTQPSRLFAWPTQ